MAPVTPRAVPSSLFILASSVCKSLGCLISAPAQEGEGGHLFRLTCSVVLWEHCKQILLACVGVLAVYGPHRVCPSSQRPVLSGSELLRLQVLCKALSTAGPAFCALPRSKLLGFRFLGTPQGHRLSLAWVLCPSQV